MNIVDKIELLYREYKFETGDVPNMLKINISDFALLREYLGIDPEEPLDRYHGMSIYGIENDLEELQVGKIEYEDNHDYWSQAGWD